MSPSSVDAAVLAAKTFLAAKFPVSALVVSVSGSLLVKSRDPNVKIVVS